MAPIDIQKLRPAELLRIVNSTRFGAVLSESQLRRYRNKAGYNIGDARSIDLLKFAAWVTWELPNLSPKEPGGYELHKQRKTEKSAQLVRSAQEIGPIPEIVNAQRKLTCSMDFKKFCEVYFADVFYLDWSKDHLKIISKIERAVKSGGLAAIAMPRGSGKTVLMQIACLWAGLIGAAEFVCLIAASAERAKDLLETIKIWIETNPLLLEDFPEVCYPIRCLERITNRQRGQKFNGKPTRIDWSSDRLVLPAIENSKAAGVVISCSGMKGSDIRGQNYARHDGKVVRPGLVMVDDPQTTESAWSPSQSQRREAILAGDVLGMAGPGKKISGLMACTVIRPGDMADNILNRDKHPEWQGERTKMVYNFPSNSKLWDKYAQLRADSLRNDGDGLIATEFYLKHRSKMDLGSKVAWENRFNDDEISEIQHAMNLKLRDEAAFWAEYQNSPIVETQGEQMLSADEIASKINNCERLSVPIGCNYLTLFIDIQQKALFYLLAGWEENFNGYILDYGTWPDQQRKYFTLRDMQNTLSDENPNAGIEGAIYSGLEKLTNKLLSKSYYCQNGEQMKIAKCLIDANWGQSTDVVYQFCRQSKFAGLVMPSHGKYVGASSMPFSDYRRKRGDRVGHHWRIPGITGMRAIRHVVIDTNYWKSFIHARLAVAMGDSGCLSIFGRDKTQHRLLADHLSAEYKIKTLARGRSVDEWKLKAARPDNHWLDCLVGAAVAASIEGACLESLGNLKPVIQKRIKLSDIQKRRRYV